MNKNEIPTIMTVEGLWDVYANDPKTGQVPIFAGDLQRLETKKAFFAGARSVIHTFEALAAKGKDQALVTVFQAMDEDIKAFEIRVSTGQQVKL